MSERDEAHPCVSNPRPVREQHLDLLPLTAGLSVGGRIMQSSNVVAGVLIEQAHDGADASPGAALLTRAGGAVISLRKNLNIRNS